MYFWKQDPQYTIYMYIVSLTVGGWKTQFDFNYSLFLWLKNIVFVYVHVTSKRIDASTGSTFSWLKARHTYTPVSWHVRSAIVYFRRFLFTLSTNLKPYLRWWMSVTFAAGLLDTAHRSMAESCSFLSTLSIASSPITEKWNTVVSSENIKRKISIAVTVKEWKSMDKSRPENISSNSDRELTDCSCSLSFANDFSHFTSQWVFPKIEPILIHEYMYLFSLFKCGTIWLWPRTSNERKILLYAHFMAPLC